MADRVIFMGWNRPVIGREQQALQLFQRAMEFWGKLQAEGRIESFEPVLLSDHGGDLNGFVMVKGEAGKLSEIQEDDTYIDITIEAGYCLDGYGVLNGFIGDDLADRLSRWSKLLGS
ncbi:hypothetical protein LCGC14_2785840 [marine sediment metagenome]|uniref:Uncharacterized protein n=1 Tax=marine sediment metagenome TaxID=412755 RepID=A0A0F8ZE17_9ZZZZ